MPITPRQREQRKTKIGSSDAAAILGIDPFCSPADVWAEKVYDTDDLKPSDAMDLGNYLERGLINIAAKKLGLKVKVGEYRTCVGFPLFAANLDGRVVGKPEAVEAKVVGRHNPTISQWGDEGTDQVADHVMIQCQQQILVARLEVVHVVAYIAGDLKVYRVTPHDDLIDLIVNKCGAWWEDHVVTKHRPEHHSVDIEVLKRIRRVPKTLARVESDVANDYLALKNLVDQATVSLKKARQNLIVSMGDTEAADWGDDEYVFTYLQQSRSTIDADTLRADHPEIAKKYTKTSTFPVLRKQKRGAIDDYDVSQAQIESDDGQGSLEQRRVPLQIDGCDPTSPDPGEAGQDGPADDQQEPGVRQMQPDLADVSGDGSR